VNDKPTGRYYRITPRFWQDTDIRNEWTEDMRFLAIYLMTSPHRNMVGLFYCPLCYIENDLQWQSKRLRVAFDALSSADFIRYDEKAQVILIVKGLKHDSPSTGKQVEGAIKVLRGLPLTHLLKDLLDAATLECECLANAMRMAFDWHSIETRIPYTVYRTPNTVENISQTPSATDVAPASPSGVIKPNEVLELWNEVCGDTLPKCQKLAPKRLDQVRARLREAGRTAEWWRAYFARIADYRFCRGENDRGWKATLDWATKSEDVVTRVLEGTYGATYSQSHVTAPPPVVVREWTMEERIEQIRREREGAK